MIRTHDLVLILDTSILPEIISSQDSSRIDQIFSGWIQTLCDGIDPPPNGKIVTIVASAGMIDDYKAGLHHRHYPKVAKTLKLVFNKALSDTVATGGPGGVRLMLEKVKPGPSESSRLVRDTYDRRFLDAVIHVAESKRWKDRKILFSTGDRSLLQDAERALVPKNYKHIHTASNMDMLRDLFAC